MPPIFCQAKSPVGDYRCLLQHRHDGPHRHTIEWPEHVCSIDGHSAAAQYRVLLMRYSDAGRSIHVQRYACAGHIHGAIQTLILPNVAPGTDTIEIEPLR